MLIGCWCVFDMSRLDEKGNVSYKEIRCWGTVKVLWDDEIRSDRCLDIWSWGTAEDFAIAQGYPIGFFLFPFCPLMRTAGQREAAQSEADWLIKIIK